MVEKGFYTVLICLFTFCGQPFNVINSTSQNYTAGRKESGRGTNYRIVLVVKKSSKKLDFKNLVVDGEELKIKVQNSNGEFVKSFSKGDTLILSSTRHISSDKFIEKQKKEYKELLVYSFKNRESISTLNPEVKEEKRYQ